MSGPGGQVERRVERVRLETDRHVVVGDITLPLEGYQSRFSDAMNRPDIDFIPIVAATITPLEGGNPVERDFVLIGRHHVRLAHPLEEGE